MHSKSLILIIANLTLLSITFTSCKSGSYERGLSDLEKAEIIDEIEEEFIEGVEATRNKDIDLYMSQLPEDLIIYDESGEIITRNQQREYALRDWAIIDTTLFLETSIDSIDFISTDSIHVWTFQQWERMMFRRDGITTDTVLTTQKHKEVWKKNPIGWFGYEIFELGGDIFINGEKYIPE